MKTYFLSSRPCALTLNGVYFGIADGFERFVEISPKDRIFVQFNPENALPIGFFLTENIRFSPPEHCEVYLLPDGVAIYARDFPPANFSLKTIAQKRENGVLATLFYQGVLQLSIDSEKGFFVKTLPTPYGACSLDFIQGLIAVKTQETLSLYTQTGECVFCERVLSYQTERNELHVLLPLSAALGRTAKCTYTLREDGCERTAFSLQQSQTANGETDDEKIRAELLPFALFESLLIGAEYAQMLTDELQAKADVLPRFLGRFIAVVPTARPDVCALVYPKAERLFDVKHFCVKIENGLIADVDMLSE